MQKRPSCCGTYLIPPMTQSRAICINLVLPRSRSLYLRDDLRWGAWRCISISARPWVPSATLSDHRRRLLLPPFLLIGKEPDMGRPYVFRREEGISSNICQYFTPAAGLLKACKMEAESSSPETEDETWWKTGGCTVGGSSGSKLVICSYRRVPLERVSDVRLIARTRQL